MSETYINLQQLADLTGRHVSYLSRLVRDGILPEGRKVWRNKEVPQKECLAILALIPTRQKRTPKTKITLDDLF